MALGLGHNLRIFDAMAAVASEENPATALVIAEKAGLKERWAVPAAFILSNFSIPFCVHASQIFFLSALSTIYELSCDSFILLLFLSLFMRMTM